MTIDRAALFGPSLQSVLKKVKLEIQDIEADIEDLLSLMDERKDVVVGQALNMMELAPEDIELAREKVESVYDESREAVAQAKALCARFRSTTGDLIDVALNVDKALHWIRETIMKILGPEEPREVPVETTERRRRYEAPRTEEEGPWERLRRRVSQNIAKLEQTGQLTIPELRDLYEKIRIVLAKLIQLVRTYFSDDSPILHASNVALKQLTKTRRRRRKYRMHIDYVRNFFGQGTKPGRYIAQGVQHYLLPMQAHLLEAAQSAVSLVKVEPPADVLTELREQAAIEERRTKQRLMKRLAQVRRQRRSRKTRRITASSGFKEESNE